mgnify:FL=1|nr:MAG TPA: hypothetical protein [Caudoviricetes sp.]
MGTGNGYEFNFAMIDGELFERGWPEEKTKDAPSLAQRLARDYLDELREKLDDKNAQITELTHELEDTRALLLETESDLHRAQGKLEGYQELFLYARKHKEGQ